MTILGWIIFGIVGGVILLFTIAAGVGSDTKKKAVGFIAAGVVAAGALFAVMWWYFHSTESGKRAFINQQSAISGLPRVVNVYTANGDIIATYEGIIDLEANKGGYLKFDFEGKRYIYYNCFIESIADVSGER